MQSDGEIVYVALGSNLGDRAAILGSAIRDLEAVSDVELLAVSPVYETDPVGPGEQDAYLNAVLSLRTRRSPSNLLLALHAIEHAHGRERSEATERWSARTLDLDLLFFGDVCLETPDLIIPHPRLHERCFVLAPLADLKPTLRHPRLGRTILELLDSLPDRDAVRRVPAPAGWPMPPFAARRG